MIQPQSRQGKREVHESAAWGGVIAFLEGDFRKSIFGISWLFFHNPKREFKNKKWGIPTWSCNPRICAVFRAQSGPRGHCRPLQAMGTNGDVKRVFVLLGGAKKQWENSNGFGICVEFVGFDDRLALNVLDRLFRLLIVFVGSQCFVSECQGEVAVQQSQSWQWPDSNRTSFRVDEQNDHFA